MKGRNKHERGAQKGREKQDCPGEGDRDEIKQEARLISCVLAVQDPLKHAEAGTHCPHIQHGEVEASPGTSHEQQPAASSPPWLSAALTSCSAMRRVFSWMLSPSARVLLGDWMRLTSRCSHSSRRRRMFLSSERYVLATVSSLSSAHHRQSKRAALSPARFLPGAPEPCAALRCWGSQLRWKMKQIKSTHSNTADNESSHRTPHVAKPRLPVPVGLGPAVPPALNTGAAAATNILLND